MMRHVRNDNNTNRLPTHNSCLGDEGEAAASTPLWKKSSRNQKKRECEGAWSEYEGSVVLW